MKRHEYTYYTTASMNMGPAHRLFGEYTSVEEARAAIDESNRKAVEYHYRPEQWLITCVEMRRWFSDDGVFVMAETREEALEAYPAEI